MKQSSPTLWLRTTLAALVVMAGISLASCGVPTPAPTVEPSAAGSKEVQNHIDAAKAAFKMNQYEEALKEALAAVKGDAQNSEAHYLLGNIYNKMAEAETVTRKRQDYLAKAVDAYLTSIKLNPGNDAAYTNVATVYYQNSQFDEAQKYVEEALKLNPNDATSHYVLGTIHLQRDPKKVPDAVEKAQVEFEKAVTSDPKLGAAYIGLANVYLFKGDFKKAVENAQKGVDLTQEAPSPYAYWALAQAQCASGDKTGGTKSIEKINNFNPTDSYFIQQVQMLAKQCK
ncbi:MAG: tetratricopeptide repeat protein [Chloroflexi bacterium]|nr:tetratricopeptide repeat protein [Chloroflexota bacterium]